MVTLEDVKSWLYVDFDDKDKDIAIMLESAKAYIYASTGCEEEKVENSGNEHLQNLYDLTVKVVTKNIYDEKELNGARLKGLYLRLKPLYYKVVIKNA